MFEISGLLLYVRCHFPSVLRVAHKGPASNGDNYCDGATLGAIIENIFLPWEITLFVTLGAIIENIFLPWEITFFAVFSFLSMSRPGRLICWETIIWRLFSRL